MRMDMEQRMNDLQEVRNTFSSQTISLLLYHVLFVDINWLIDFKFTRIMLNKVFKYITIQEFVVGKKKLF